ncbi:hypothetical protein [Microcoleus sp. FACHB-1515]|nr:hypothetical protein [Microcoleus sp. FACHB-1515]
MTKSLLSQVDRAKFQPHFYNAQKNCENNRRALKKFYGNVCAIDAC